MTRIAVLKREDMNAEQGKVFDDVKSEGGPLGGPYWAYIRHPKLMRQLQDTSNYLGQSGGLGKRERQMAIMAIIRFWGAEYPWAVQTRAALAMGIAQETIDAINAGKTPSIPDAREKMAYDVAVELLSNRKLADATYNAAAKLFGDEALVTLIATVGAFSMTCLTTIAFDCTPPDEVPHRLQHL
ncbi:MAG: carboxymuconolactone decarboxylase family protein [Beijerinckiaceae bacterium]